MTISVGMKRSGRSSPLRSARLWTAAAVACYGAICVLSQIPGLALTQLPFSIWDKGAHFIAYGVLGFFVYGAVALRSVGWKTALFLTVGICLLLGGLDEVHQIFVPGRFPGLDDVTADALGGTGGGILGIIILRTLSARS